MAEPIGTARLVSAPDVWEFSFRPAAPDENVSFAWPDGAQGYDMTQYDGGRLIVTHEGPVGSGSVDLSIMHSHCTWRGARIKNTITSLVLARNNFAVIDIKDMLVTHGPTVGQYAVGQRFTVLVIFNAGTDNAQYLQMYFQPQRKAGS